MKRILTLILLLSLSLMYGCIKPAIIDQEIVGVALISPEGTINEPKIDDQPMGYTSLQPGKRAYLISFVPGINQYGDKTGLSNSKYTIKNVEIRMPSKNENDTVFWVADLPRNQFMWVPGWTGTINPYNGFAWAPFIGLDPYKFDCGMDYGSQLPYGMPSQTVEILVEAEAPWMKVEFVAEDLTDKYPGGYYKLDVLYSDQEDTNRFIAKLESPGAYTVFFYNANDKLIDSWEYAVLASWFWIDEVFYINVGGNGQCGL